MKRIIFILFTLVFILKGCSENQASKRQYRPNILFILSDDHTKKAISAYGGIFAEYAATENLDRLAAEGVLFNNVFCTNSICSPSRATILTGTYSHINGVRILNQLFDSSQVTFPKILQASGYKTGVFGKWHLKSTPTGFDDYKVLVEQGRYQDPEFVEKGVDSMVTRKGWSTDVITGLAKEFIRENKDGDEPFFLFCNYKTTHDPWSSRPPYDTLFSNIEIPQPPNFFDTYENRSEAFRRLTLRLELINQGTFPHDRLEGVSDAEQRAYIYQQYIKAFLRCGRVLDENIGSMMDFLEEEGLLKNTIVIYTADQGHFLGEHGFFSKRIMLEEPLGMPLMIRFPDGSELNGKTEDHMITNMDFAPSVLEMAGLEPHARMQGKSFIPLLKGDTSAIHNWRESVYYRYWQHLWHRQVTAHFGIRTDRYKLIFYNGHALGYTDFDPVEPEWELFDLEKDPMEMFNAYDEPEYGDIIFKLKKEILEKQAMYEDLHDEYPEMISIMNDHFWTPAEKARLQEEKE